MRRKKTAKRPIRGRGKVSDLLKKANDLLKKTRVISRAAHAVAPTFPMAYPVAKLAESYGYGKRRRLKGARGRGFVDWIKNKALPFLKKTKIISTVGNALAPVVPFAGTVGKIAGTAGYGRKRRKKRTTAPLRAAGRRKHKSMRGRGIGHVYTPQSGVGIAGTATYSSGRVQF